MAGGGFVRCEDLIPGRREAMIKGREKTGAPKGRVKVFLNFSPNIFMVEEPGVRRRSKGRFFFPALVVLAFSFFPQPSQAPKNRHPGESPKGCHQTGRTAVSLWEIEKADFILAIGADPVQEAPMLALAMRQAFRNGASVAVLDSRPIFQSFPFVHVPVAPREAEGCLSTMVKRAESSPFR
jgi:hypothetical protein